MDALRLFAHAVDAFDRNYSHIYTAFLEIDIAYQCCLYLVSRDPPIFTILLNIVIAVECLIFHLLIGNLRVTDRPR